MKDAMEFIDIAMTGIFILLIVAMVVGAKAERARRFSKNPLKISGSSEFGLGDVSSQGSNLDHHQGAGHDSGGGHDGSHS